MDRQTDRQTGFALGNYWLLSVRVTDRQIDRHKDRKIDSHTAR